MQDATDMELVFSTQSPYWLLTVAMVPDIDVEVSSVARVSVQAGSSWESDV